MRLIVIDASPINGGPASYAVDVAASSAEKAGAEVVRVRLYDVLNHATKVMAMADAVVVGAPAKMRASSTSAAAMLRRFLGAYAGVSSVRGARKSGSLAAGKRAAVLPSGGLAGFAAAAAGFGVAGAAKALLAEAGVEMMPTTYIPSQFTSASTRDITREAAEKLARKLIAPDEPKPPARRRTRAERDASLAAHTQAPAS